MDKCLTLKQLLVGPDTLVMPDAYDPISAKLIEYAGFKAVQCSGYSFSIAKGYPKERDITFSENIAITQSIVSAIQIPVMVDGEDGFGDGEFLQKNIESYIKIGAAGINLEDQNLREPASKDKIISKERMLAKIADAIAVKQTAHSPHFILNARTDALRSLDDRKAAQKLAIERANSYLEAGADLCFIAYIKTRAEVELFAKEVHGPLSVAAGLAYNMQEFSLNDCRELGVRRVSLPSCMIFSAIQGMLKTLALVRDTGAFDEALRQELVFSDMSVLEELLRHKGK